MPMTARRSAPCSSRSMVLWRPSPAMVAVVHGSGTWTQLPQPRLGSSDADIARASELQHAVERLDGDVHLGRPTLVRAGAQPVADHLFPPPDGGLGPSAFVVPGPLLPSHAPVLGDAVEMAVARRRRGLGIRRWHRTRTRRHDDGRLGVALGNAGINTVLVVRADTLIPWGAIRTRR